MNQATPTQSAPQYTQPPPKNINLGLVAAITAAVVVVVCVGSYFLFFSGGQPTEQTAMAEPTERPAIVDFSSTRDVSDLEGVWDGHFLYTEISGVWEGTSSYTVSTGYDQPIKLKITSGSPELNWRQAILRIEGGDVAVWNAGFVGGHLEFSGEWQSCDVSIVVEYDAERGGFKGTGEFIHPQKHATFEFSMTSVADSSWDDEFQATVGEQTSAQPSPSDTLETVSAQTVVIDVDYDSGEGVYTGEVKDGVPHGNGRFEMVSSDKGEAWTYEGQWEDGDIIGEGTMSSGAFVYTGTFRGGLLNGLCEVTENSILRYKGMCADGKLHGQGTLHTKSGRLVFAGMFENDMLVESATDRQARGKAFIRECEDMDELLYEDCMVEDSMFDYPVAVWGSPIAMGEQTGNGTIVIGHMGDDAYPICLVHRYGVDETKMTSDDWINAWGVVVGIYKYEVANGRMVTCPLVEVIYWDNAQE